MNLSDALDASTPKPFSNWLAPAAGLLAATSVACLDCRVPTQIVLSWTGLVGSAAERVLEVSLVCAATVWGLGHIQPDKNKVSVHRPIVKTSLDAAWLAPLALLVCENSAWAMGIAAALVASTTKSFRSFHDHSDTTDTEGTLVPLLTGDSFSSPSPSQWHWRLFPAVCIALCAEGAALAGFAGTSFLATILAGIGSAVWMLSFTSGEPPLNQEIRSVRRSSLRVVLTLAMAILVTAAGLVPYVRHTRGFGGLGIPFASKSRHGSSGAQRGGVTRKGTTEGSASDFAEAYSGIVLWPKKQTSTTLVAPAPLLRSNVLDTNRSANPLVVPFNGVYWFFEAPDIRPPKGSREAHGSPEMLSTRSTDQRPLSMEAHQNLGTLIDLDCCSRIQVAIRNTDRYPETVSLELILTNTSLPRRPSQSLGAIMVKSTRPWQLYGDRPPVGETLSFEVPAHTAIHHFDEVTIVFRLDHARAEFGAKIAIERFVLVPRGL
jgi:hypothetical protein